MLTLVIVAERYIALLLDVVESMNVVKMLDSNRQQKIQTYLDDLRKPRKQDDSSVAKEKEKSENSECKMSERAIETGVR